MTDHLVSLPILILNPHNRCNCRCVMCDIWKRDSIEEIGTQDLERLSSDLERLRVQWVVLSGGEPLMHSNLFGLCQTLRRRNIRITLLSTGLLLERYAGRVIEHIDDVIVSLDGPPAVHDRIRRVPGAFSTLKRGVEALKLLRSDFAITARSTVQRLNCGALRHTVETARFLRLDAISFLAVDVTSDAFNRLSIWPDDRQNQVAIGARELPTLEAEIDALIAQGECGAFVTESDQKLRRIVQHFRSRLAGEEPISPRCNAPWVSSVIEANGDVRPCFFHAPVGRIGPEKSLAEILNGPAAVKFRRELNVESDAVCRRCVCSLYRPEA